MQNKTIPARLKNTFRYYNTGIGRLIIVGFTFTSSIAIVKEQKPSSARLCPSLTNTAQFSSSPGPHFPIGFLVQTSKFQKTAIHLTEHMRWSFHCWQGLSWRTMASDKNSISRMKLPAYTSPENNQRHKKESTWEVWMKEGGGVQRNEGWEKL